MNLLYVIQCFISIVILICVVYILWKPNFVKYAFKWVPNTLYDLAENAKEINNYTLYSRPNNKKLIVFFNGGAFIYSVRQNSYGLLNALSKKLPEYDILVFDYPVRFNYTVQETLQNINETLKNFMQYESYYGIGESAGTLLLGTFCSKEADIEYANRIKVPQIGIKFSCYVGITGVYCTRFTNQIVNNLFQFYIIRGSTNGNLYSAYNLNIPKLIISNKTDFLYHQTNDFLQKQPSKSRIFENQNLPHTFIFNMHFTETSECINLISEFIENS